MVGWSAIQTGDRSAEDELLRSVCGRLKRLTYKMLKQMPSVRRWVEAEDVLQNALLRLMRVSGSSSLLPCAISTGWPPSKFAAS